VLPLPLLQDGSPAASLEGEALVELEILWDDLTSNEIKSCTQLQTIRILATQNPDDVKVDVDVIPGVATQRTGLAMDEALRELNQGRSEQALAILREAVRQLRDLGSSDSVAQSLATLESMIRRIEETGTLSSRMTRNYRFTSSHMRKMKSHALWSLDEQAPMYSRKSIPPPASGASPTPPPEDPDEKKA
jgi:hypothetical protein